MPEKHIPADCRKIADILVAAGLAPSKSEARRLIDGGGIKVDDEKVSGFNFEITDSMAANGFVLSKGKKARFKIIVG